MAIPGSMQAPPRVSVLMTTYSGARLIAESIDSVLAQSFADFELLVVDDASTDDTALVLAGYADPRLRILHNDRNLGVVGARNRGFAEARGAYVAPIDHDDIWLPTRLAEGVARLDADPATVLVGTRICYLIDGRRIPEPMQAAISPLLLHWMLFMDCPLTYSTLLFRRAAAQRPDGTLMRPDLSYADDYDLLLRMALLGRVAVLDSVLTLYRVHAGNTTRSVAADMYRHAVQALGEHLAGLMGAEAGEGAALLVWHVGRRRAAADRATLRRLGLLLQRLQEAFVAAYRPEPADLEAIEAYTRHCYWRVLRASLRSGRVWMLGGGAGWAPPGDLAASLAVGLLRLPLRLLRRDEARPE